MSSAAEADEADEARRWAVRTRAFAGAAALVWVVLFFGYQDLVVPLLRQPEFDGTYLLETGWGALYTFLVGVPLVSVALHPRACAAVFQVGLAGVAVGAAALVVPEWWQLVPALGLLLTSGGLVALTHRAEGAVHGHLGRFDDPDRAPSAPGAPSAPSAMQTAMRALTLVALGPLLTYAADMVEGRRGGRPPTDDVTWGLDHWPMQAALAVALVLAAGLAATSVPGWPVTAWAVALTAVWMGGWSVVHPDQAGSFGTLWGWAAVVWSAALSAATVLRQVEVRDASWVTED